MLIISFCLPLHKARVVCHKVKRSLPADPPRSKIHYTGRVSIVSREMVVLEMTAQNPDACKESCH